MKKSSPREVLHIRGAVRGKVCSFKSYLGLLPLYFFFLASFSLTVARLISLGRGRRQSKSTVTDPFRTVTGRKQPCISDMGLGQGYRLVAGGPHTGLLADQYVPPIPGGKIRNCITLL
ncbi:hypothetical protein B296_00017763 [Ensete ventricosum]|uniref:Uncharacterized protein n=1 Tax=Ensete ventricosum TaxID=4639 RepID=A0A427B4K4_ENSVE|nr:hypothetical protein B296_00017763 [Ensete ventricosum]